MEFGEDREGVGGGRTVKKPRLVTKIGGGRAGCPIGGRLGNIRKKKKYGIFGNKNEIQKVSETLGEERGGLGQYSEATKGIPAHEGELECEDDSLHSCLKLFGCTDLERSTLLEFLEAARKSSPVQRGKSGESEWDTGERIQERLLNGFRTRKMDWPGNPGWVRQK